MVPVKSQLRIFFPHPKLSILEVEKSASMEEIKKAHRKMVRKYHPDRLQGVSEDIVKLAEEKFLLVQKAYENIIKSK